MQKSQFTRSWIRRKQFEARLNAMEIGRMLFGDGKGGKPAREISTSEMLGLLGANI